MNHGQFAEIIWMQNFVFGINYRILEIVHERKLLQYVDYQCLQENAHEFSDYV